MAPMGKEKKLRQVSAAPMGKEKNNKSRYPRPRWAKNYLKKKKRHPLPPCARGLGDGRGDPAGIRGPDGLKGEKKLKAGIRSPDGQIKKINT